MKGSKKSTKKKRFIQTASNKSKPKKSSTNNSSDAKDKAEKDTQNKKWKTIRAEVVALFDKHKKNGDKNASKPNKTFDKDVLRGITIRPSGKFQAQLYFGGRSRYIGVFDSQDEAALAYEMIRSRLKDDSKKVESPPRSKAPSGVTTVAMVKNCKEGKDTTAIDTESSAAATMRSITPSPTPRNNVHCKTTKALTT
eukprot:CAMPEP_0197278046 /NCGR_PEP_ID=MMETSP1432-20130617/17998_1 /TAXON_ID=44447 /ORGANISM="Pseudo-nitzschia delicatissima, Strain UNC1205" /LENGTH=195 /DNA_ID=CAMNT_0042744355 /DNA_START=258 /DNA_END=845 /DNA_ORIENTATION=-